MLAIREESERLHGIFMSMTQQLLTRDLDSGLYEDQVLELLGMNSYELLSLDKLIKKLRAHMLSMGKVGRGWSP